MGEQSLPPTTTAQDDLTVAGQRKVNMIWELTQALIALIVVIGNISVAVYQGFKGTNGFMQPAILSNSLFLVIGFYFSRTNHQAIGGIGMKANEEQDYKGR